MGKLDDPLDLELGFARRFRSTRWSGSLRAVDYSIEDDRLAEWVSRAQTSTVELMTHPGWVDEFHFLMSSDWRDLIGSVSLGTIEDLPEMSA